MLSFYSLALISSAKSFLIFWSNSGLVKTLIAVIANDFPCARVYGCAFGSPVEKKIVRCYDSALLR